jgi:hypothetical protein
MNKDGGNKKGMSDQNFQKFAAQLVSPSEVFESRSARHRVNIPESLELLGSLASLTRSSLIRPPVEAQPQVQHPGLPQGSSSSGSSSTNSANSANPSASSGTSSTEPRVQYETSHKEYRQALEDQRITDALCKLQAHRENSQRAQQSNRSAFGSKAGHRSGAVIRPDQNGQMPQGTGTTQTTALSGFQHASLPEVSVSVKPSPMRKTTGAFQSILRPSR